MKECKDDKMIENLILPIYTKIGRNIIAAAMYSQAHEHGTRCSVFYQWAKYPEFIMEIAPAGEIVITNTCINDLSKNNAIKVLGGVVRTMLEKASFYKYSYNKNNMYNIIKEKRLSIRLEERSDRTCTKKVAVMMSGIDTNKLDLTLNSATITNIVGYTCENEVAEFTIRQAWIIVDFLLGSKSIFKNYSKEEIDEVIGHEKNPIEIEKVNLLLQELKKLEEKTKINLNDLYAKERKEKERIEKKYQKKLKEMRGGCKEEILVLLDKMQM